MILKILITILLLQQTLQQRPPCGPTEYQFNLLVLTWPRELCSQTTCQPDWQERWDNQSLTIHGFWPSSTNLAYLSCFKEYSYDPYCHVAYPFDFEKFTDEEQVRLNESWPHFTTKKEFFLKYEWDKHGTCYLYLEKNGTRTTLSNDDIFRQYMLGTVDKKLGLNMTLETGGFDSKQQLSRKLGIPSENYIAICKQKNKVKYFYEIRICYSIAFPREEQMIECPPSTDQEICQFPIKVK